MRILMNLTGVCLVTLSACSTNPGKGYSETPKHLSTPQRLALLPHYQKDCHKNMDEFEHLLRVNPIAAHQKAVQVEQRLRGTNMQGTVCYHVPGYMHRFENVMLAAKIVR